MTFDVVLTGGSVVDGTGAPARQADVALAGDRIAAVGDLSAADARERLDVEGLVVAPGFIDCHTHSDLAPFLPEDELALRLASVRQGVTTEICGNCGFSTFPTSHEHSASVALHLQALFGREAQSYATLADYRAALDGTELVSNLGVLVGHGTLRAGVIGFEDRAPDGGERRRMEVALDRAFDDGALGFSSGLIYTPGVYAETDELVELARVAARRGRPYTTHLRDEFDGVQNALDEAFEIGRRSGAAVQISHHKVAGRRNWGRSAATLASIKDARAGGLDVGIDVYPYTAGSTMLAALLPPWAGEGGVRALLGRIRDPSARRRLERDFADGLPGWQNMVAFAGWEEIAVAGAPRHPELEGRTIADLAERAGRSPVDAVCDLLLAEEASVTVVIHMMEEADVQRILAAAFCIVASDGIPLPGKPHPRWAGTFARILAAYVRESGLLGLEEAVGKMTAEPAERFGLSDRGRLADGLAADVVVFDPATVADRATYESPLEAPAGVLHVIINGSFAVRDGEATGRHTGRVVTPT